MEYRRSRIRNAAGIAVKGVPAALFMGLLALCSGVGRAANAECVKNELVKLLAGDGGGNDEFGISVAISGSNSVVGSALDGDNGYHAGSAYLFGTGCPAVTIDPDPLIAGQNATVRAENVNPSKPSFLAYSLVGPGSTFVAPLHVTLDLANPQQAGSTAMSDATGTAEWVLPIPGGAAGLDVWIQACQYELVTEVLATDIQ